TITFALPFVAGFAALAADERSWTTARVALLGGLAFVLSRVWFPINQGPIDEGPYLDFPAQWYFMNFPPWMSNEVYWVAIAGLALAVACVAWLLPRHVDDSSVPRS
ncbi:MAG: hypothetical protein ABFR53_12180, partial [Actinomycetota bacterium]